MSQIAQTVAAWLLSYAVHSTVLLGAAALVTARLRDHAWKETLWKAALIGGLITVPAQALAGFRPVVGRVSLTAPAPAAAPLATGVAPQAAPLDALQPLPTITEASPAASPPTASALPSPSSAPDAEGPADVGRSFAPDWRVVLLGAWAAVVLLFLARLVWRQWSLARLLRDRAEVGDPGVLALLEELRGSAGVRARVRLTRSERCATPIALGTREVCVPARFVSELPREEQRGALAHELAHLARRDPLWHLAAGLAEAVFFFQPLNRLARRRLRESAEYLCDDWAVRQTGSPLGLARCLVEVARWVTAGSPVPEGAVAMAETGSGLARRVERLVRHDAVPPPARAGRRVAAACALLAAVAVFAPAVTPLAAEIAAKVQEATVVRHPNPAEPLEKRWEWAKDAAGRRTVWVAWAVPAVGNGGGATIHDSGSFDLDELSLTPLTQILGYDAAQAVVMFRVNARTGRVDRISTRLGRVGMNLRGTPVYWLGAARVGESLDWLEARERAERDPELRKAVVGAIALHGDSERVVPLLRRWLAGDPIADIRSNSAEGLARHPGAASLAAILAAVRGDADEQVRMDATESVGEMDFPAARPALRELLRGAERAEVRREAAESYGEYGDADALREVESAAFRDADDGVRMEAVESMGSQVPPSRAVPALARVAWTHPKLDMQREAAETLGDLEGQVGLAALDSIIARHPSADTQREAVETLGSFPAAVALPRLQRILRTHPSVDARREAAETLGDLPRQAGLEALWSIVMSDAEHDVMLAAVEALGSFPPAVSGPRLRQVADRHPREEVRRAAREELDDSK